MDYSSNRCFFRHRDYRIDFFVVICVFSLAILAGYALISSFPMKEQVVAIRWITEYISPSRHIAH